MAVSIYCVWRWCVMAAFQELPFRPPAAATRIRRWRRLSGNDSMRAWEPMEPVHSSARGVMRLRRPLSSSSELGGEFGGVRFSWSNSARRLRWMRTWYLSTFFSRRYGDRFPKMGFGAINISFSAMYSQTTLGMARGSLVHGESLKEDMSALVLVCSSML